MTKLPDICTPSPASNEVGAGEGVSADAAASLGGAVATAAAASGAAGPSPTKRERRLTRAQAAARAAAQERRAADEAFMELALEQAKLAAAAGEVPIGAVVVHQPYDRGCCRHTGPARVIASGHNLRETLRDPSAHAEFSAMLAAAGALDAWRLADCTVYVTLEPCIMCAGLMQQARVARCVYGAADPKAGALGSLYEINADARLNHRFEVTPGVLQDQCQALLQEFFQFRRKKMSKG